MVTVTRSQESYNPIDYGFEWTNDGWYKFDRKAAIKAARAARDARARELKKAGIPFKKFTDGNCLISRGGIGSGRPHIEEVVPVYYLNIG